GLATSGRAECNVANLDIRHELQFGRAKRPGSVNQLKPGLRCDSHLLQIDVENTIHPGHVDDCAGGGGAGRQRMKTAHRSDRAWEPVRSSQDGLDLFHGLRIHELLWRSHDPAVIICNLMSHPFVLARPKAGIEKVSKRIVPKTFPTLLHIFYIPIDCP